MLRGRARRGSALVLVLLMTLAVAALAVAAIFMTSSAGLLSRFYDKERLFQLAAESGLQMALSRLRNDMDFTVADTGFVTLLPGVTVPDADGTPLVGVGVFVYAMTTGDTSSAGSRTVTLISRAYDSFGTRHVRRMDVRLSSLSDFVLFADSMPSGESFGPAIINGRVHSNGVLRSRQNTVYQDSVTAVTSFSGSSVTFAGDTASGWPELYFPRDSQYSGLATLAAAGNLSYTPTRHSRLEFVAYDADADGTVESTEGYARIFELDNDAYVQLLEVNPGVWGSGNNARHAWNDFVIQRQCGAFYLRSGRWHFFPVTTHHTSWAWTIISTIASGDFPTTAPSNGNTYNENGAVAILQQPTARCFPVGSPYLVNTERFTMADGTISGTPSNNTTPWGSSTNTAQRYGGSDTTFTASPRSCAFSSSGACTGGSQFALGAWHAFAGTADGALPAQMSPYHWPLDVSRNANSKGVINVSGNVYVHGTVAGRVTLRVGGLARLLESIRHATDPLDPNGPPCTHQFGLISTGSAYIVDGVMTRVRRFGKSANPSGTWDAFLGAQPRFDLHANLLSTGGTMYVQNRTELWGNGIDRLDCPTVNGVRTSTGGCLVHVGSQAVKWYTMPHEGGTNDRGGFRPNPKPDRCMGTGARPPYFPTGYSYRVLRTVELSATRANTNARIEAILRRLRGQNLD